jgi:hypothetical protein
VQGERKTIRTKAWVQFDNKWTFYWPCVIYIRQPKKHSEKGKDYLRNEKRIFLFPCGNAPPIKPYKHGVCNLSLCMIKL